MGTEELREGGAGTMDGSEGRESTLPVCAREWKRKGGSQLQGGHGGWLRWCTPPPPPLPCREKDAGAKRVGT